MNTKHIIATLRRMAKPGEKGCRVLLDAADILEKFTHPRMRFVEDILAQRVKQVELLGYTPEYDRRWGRGELGKAAAVYAQPPYLRVCPPGSTVPFDWPWDEREYHPSDRRTELIRAAALILAEMERLECDPIPP